MRINEVIFMYIFGSYEYEYYDHGGGDRNHNISYV